LLAFLQALKPSDFEVLTSSCGFEAAIDVTDPVVTQGTQPYSEIVNRLSQASVFDFQHMKAHFQDPAVAGMTDGEFQAYLDANFPLGIVPKSLDPYWVIEDGDYFDNLRSETNVTALDPGATLDIEPQWDGDGDGLLDPCEPMLLRGTAPVGLAPHLDNLGAGQVDDLPGTLSDGIDYYYLLNERGSPPLTLTMDKLTPDDTVRILFAP